MCDSRRATPQEARGNKEKQTFGSPNCLRDSRALGEFLFFAAEHQSTMGIKEHLLEYDDDEEPTTAGGMIRHSRVVQFSQGPVALARIG